MASREDVRQAIVTAIEARKASWADNTLIVEYDNRELVNRDTHVNPFLCVELLYIDGYQASLFPDPVHRILGTIILTAKVKQGSGSKAANDLLDHFYTAIHLTDTITPIRTHAAKLVRAKSEAGWVGESAVIPFWYDN